MSIARHHAEWLSLVPVSGPFLSLPVLMEAFNTGLEPHDPEHVRLLRQEYANWQESLEKRKADPAPHHNWIRFVLTKALELDDRVLTEGQAIPQTLHVEVLCAVVLEAAWVQREQQGEGAILRAFARWGLVGVAEISSCS